MKKNDFIAEDDSLLLNTQSQRASTGQFRCPACGGTLSFDAQTQKLKCEHCGTEIAVEVRSDVTERDFVELHRDHKWDTDVKIIRCENCGAESVLRKGEVATVCAFCGSSSVLEKSEMDCVKPDSVIPFHITRSEAVKRCLTWLKKRFYAPKKFKKQVSLDTVHGVYTPVWTFDSTTETHYSGTVGKRYVETERVNGKEVTRTKIKWFHVQGTIQRCFDDVLISGSMQIDDTKLGKIAPFDQANYVLYNDAFLAGYEASNYNVDPFTAFQRAEAQMKEEIQRLILQRHDADVAGTLRLDLRHIGKSFKYILFPVYVCTERYKNKVFNQYMNGVHGRITGKIPLSVVKVGLTVLLALAAIVGIAYLVIKYGD